VWSPQGSTLLLIDRLYGKILAYQKDGRCLGTVSDEVESSFAGFVPSRLAVRGDEFILGLSGHRIMTLDASFMPKEQADFRSEAVRGPIQVDSMFMLQATTADVLTFSDYQGEEGWKSAFFRVPLTAPANFQLLGEPTVADSSRVFYRLGNQYIASIGETGYILQMDPEMRIVKNERGSSELTPLAAFAPGSRQLSPLPGFHSLKDTVVLMNAVEHANMPVGMFGWQNYLYVVSHSHESGTSVWKISKLDPRTDRLVGWTVIPTEAAHLTVIPGAKQWSFLEKGHVYGYGEESAETMLHVPTSLIEGIAKDDQAVCE
jgi:hypothetical protein